MDIFPLSISIAC